MKGNTVADKPAVVATATPAPDVTGYAEAGYATADEYRTALREEYSTYVAVSPIYVGTARAFNVGDPVPKSHVDRGVVGAEMVAKKSTKAAAAAIEKAGV